MADISAVEDKFFTIASETYENNLSSSISALDDVVPVNSANAYDDGDHVVLTVDPGTPQEASFIGTKASSPSRFINCQWTEGNLGVGHASGATIVDYDSATHHNLQTKGIRKFANDDGTLKQQPIRDALGLQDAASAGWEILPYTFQTTTGYNKGNRSFEVTVANNNLTDELSPGMRFKVTRGTAAPTQCTDLEASSSQYASKSSPTGITFTDDLTVEAWVKLESYTEGYIVSRHSGTAGWYLRVNSNGTIQCLGRTSANDYITSYQSIPLGRWVHVAASLDMSASSGKIYIDGVEVPSAYTNGADTSLTQAGDLVIGNITGGTSYFDGKLADVRVWSTVRSETEIRDNMCQLLSGSETGLVGYWKLNGDFNDSTANANHLTPSGGAVATAVDNPFNTVEHAIITKVAYAGSTTTLTLFTPTGHTIPNMTLNSPFYSTQSVPFGFPRGSGKWVIEYLGGGVQTGNGGAGWTNQFSIYVPQGEWLGSYDLNIYRDRAAAETQSWQITLSDTSTTESHQDRTAKASVGALSSVAKTALPVSKTFFVTNTAAATKYVNSENLGTTGGNLFVIQSGSVTRFTCAYL